MSSVVAYHRPTSLDEAARLLTESNRRVLAGGTAIVAESRANHVDDIELVDLQALGLDTVTEANGRVALGAMVRLSDVSTHSGVGDLLRDLARRELPSVMRNQATVGGTIAAGSADSVFVAGLIVHDAVVEFQDGRSVPLAQVCAEGVGDSIVVAVSIDPSGGGAIVATGRTPADDPIVAAVARATENGIRLALTGVAVAVIEVDPDDPTAGLSPPTDFRGSGEYRLELATTLSGRAMEAVA